jgi:hypothetical protein
MAKHNSMYIPLPMPPTTKEKYAVYLTIGRDIEMFLYDGKQVFTPDFPDIPINKFEIGDGRIIRQETLARICRYMMSQSTVVYNEDYNIWEAVSNDPF